MSEQIDLLSWTPPEPPKYFGATFDLDRHDVSDGTCRVTVRL